MTIATDGGWLTVRVLRLKKGANLGSIETYLDSSMLTHSSMKDRYMWQERFVWIGHDSLCLHTEAPVSSARSPLRAPYPALSLGNVKAVIGAQPSAMEQMNAPKAALLTGIRILTRDGREMILGCPDVAHHVDWIHALNTALLNNELPSEDHYPEGAHPEFLLMLGILQSNEIDQRANIQIEEQESRTAIDKYFKKPHRSSPAPSLSDLLRHVVEGDGGPITSSDPLCDDADIHSIPIETLCRCTENDTNTTPSSSETAAYGGDGTVFASADIPEEGPSYEGEHTEQQLRDAITDEEAICFAKLAARFLLDKHALLLNEARCETVKLRLVAAEDRSRLALVHARAREIHGLQRLHERHIWVIETFQELEISYSAELLVAEWVGSRCRLEEQYWSRSFYWSLERQDSEGAMSPSLRSNRDASTDFGREPSWEPDPRSPSPPQQLASARLAAVKQSYAALDAPETSDPHSSDALMIDAMDILMRRHRGAHAFSGVRAAGFVSKPPTVTSSFRRRFTGDKWVQQFMWLDPLSAATSLHYGPADGNATRSVPIADVVAVAPLSSAELAAAGCPTAALDFGFFIEFGGSSSRKVLFAVQKVSERDAWIAVVRQAARHARICQWESKNLSASIVRKSERFTGSAVIVANCEYDQREQIKAAEEKLRYLALGRAYKRLRSRLAAATGALRSADPSIMSQNGTLDGRTVPFEGSFIDAPSSSRFGSFEEYKDADRGALNGLTRADVERGTWLYRSVRLRAQDARHTSTLSDYGGSAKMPLKGSRSDVSRPPTASLWSRCFVRLMDRKLTYSAEEHEAPVDEVLLSKLLSVNALPESELRTLQAPFPFGFSIQTIDTKEMTWCAENADLRNFWVSVLDAILIAEDEAARERVEAAIREQLVTINAERVARESLASEESTEYAELEAAADQEIDALLRVMEAAERERKRRETVTRNPAPQIPISRLDAYCRVLPGLCARQLSDAVAFAIFDADGLCLQTSPLVRGSGDHPHLIAGRLATLMSAAAELHPSVGPSAASGPRVFPIEMIIDLDKRVLRTSEVDRGVYAFSLTVQQHHHHQQQQH